MTEDFKQDLGTTMVVGDIALSSKKESLEDLKLTTIELLKDNTISSYLNGDFIRKKITGITGVG